MEKISTNLYKENDTYYRLLAKGVTPNGCWLIAPIYFELKDIDLATGKDIYGTKTIDVDTGTIPASTPYIKY